MRKSVLSVVLLAWCGGVSADPPALPTELKGAVGKPLLFDVKVDKDKKVGWAPGFDKSDCPIVRLYSEDPGTLSFMAIPEKDGKFVLTFWTEGEVKFSQTVITVGAAPAPSPDPQPDPNPNGRPPIPADGLHVLMVYEASDLGRYPRGQLEVMNAKQVRDYLNEKCPPGPNNVTREWRIWDQNVDVSGDSPLWQAAMKRPRKSLPWVIVSNGRAGYEGPLPNTVQDMMALLKKFGG